MGIPPSFGPEDVQLTRSGEISMIKLSEILNIFSFLLTRVTEVAPTSGRDAKGNAFLCNLGTKPNLLEELGAFEKQTKKEI